MGKRAGAGVDGDADSETAASAEGEGEAARDEAADIEKQAMEEIPLGRSHTGRSLASEILEQRNKDKVELDGKYGLVYLFKRMGRINRSAWSQYAIGGVAAVRASLSPPI